MFGMKEGQPSYRHQQKRAFGFEETENSRNKEDDIAHIVSSNSNKHGNTSNTQKSMN
jgi:hypothetical protein